MDVPLLVDSIVRQTMVLIAQLSTTAGYRTPLSHVADRVFLDLVAELERQRLGKKVIADMFGLALRSYQQKVQRLSESATERGHTLWSAVFAFLRERGATTKMDVLQRFAQDDETSVRGILTDLVESGLVYHSGKGDQSLYRVTDDADWSTSVARDEGRALVAMLSIYREGPVTREILAERLRVDPSSVEFILSPLVSDGRVVVRDDGCGPTYAASSCAIPLGVASGFEAGIIDHFRAVSSALAAKLRSGALSSAKNDAVGGSTLTFEVQGGHPLEQEVLGTLSRMRQDLIKLWDRVAAENERHPLSDTAYRVTAYVGQYVEREEARDEA